MQEQTQDAERPVFKIEFTDASLRRLAKFLVPYVQSADTRVTDADNGKQSKSDGVEVVQCSK